MMTVGDDHSADAVASQPGVGAFPVASSPSNKSLILVNEGFEDTADCYAKSAMKRIRRNAKEMDQNCTARWGAGPNDRIRFRAGYAAY
jgi:hypothetical protein